MRKWNGDSRRKFLNFQSTATDTIYHIKFFATCTTTHVVYLITCPCKKQYIGRTIRTFTVRVNEHISNIIAGKTNHSMPKHYLRHHNKDPKGTVFQVIDKYTVPWRGGSSKRGVSRIETYWIYTLQTYVPYGLNVDWDINAFINTA